VKLLPLALLLAISVSSVGCAASVRRIGYDVPPASAAVAATTGAPACPVVLTTDSAAVAGARRVGEIRYGDTGFSMRCDEARALRLFQSDACAAGANVVLLTDERAPGLLSSCYRANASLYAVDSLALAEVGSLRSPDEIVVSRANRSGRTLLGIVGSAVGFAVGYLAADLIIGGVD
jgi:hypothetical protein